MAVGTLFDAFGRIWDQFGHQMAHLCEYRRLTVGASSLRNFVSPPLWALGSPRRPQKLLSALKVNIFGIIMEAFLVHGDILRK